jgi:hypothetical protein
MGASSVAVVLFLVLPAFTADLRIVNAKAQDALTLRTLFQAARECERACAWPLANLRLSVLAVSGMPMKRFGDGTGRLVRLSPI